MQTIGQGDKQSYQKSDLVTRLINYEYGKVLSHV